MNLNLTVGSSINEYEHEKALSVSRIFNLLRPIVIDLPKATTAQRNTVTSDPKPTNFLTQD